MLSRDVKTFISLAAAHFIVDCYGGFFPMFKYLERDHIDLWWAGMIASVTLFIGAAMQPLVGLWADHGRQRLFVVLGAAMTCMGVLLGPIGLHLDQLGPAGTYVSLFLLMLFVRVGQALYHPSGASLAGNLSSLRRSTLLALFISGGMVGFAISQYLFSKAHALLDGHTEWLLLPAAAVMLFVAAWCRPPRAPRPRRIAYRDVARTLVSLRGELAGLFGIQMFQAALYIGVIFLMPEFLARRGYPTWLIEGGGAGCWIFGAVLLMIPVAHLADSVGRRTMLIACIALGMAFFYAMVWAPTLPVPMFVALCLLAGGFMGTTNPLGVSLGQHLAPQHASLISGVLMGLAWAIGGFAPWVVGSLATVPSLGEPGALALLGMTGFISLGLALTLKRPASDPLIEAVTAAGPTAAAAATPAPASSGSPAAE